MKTRLEITEDARNINKKQEETSPSIATALKILITLLQYEKISAEDLAIKFNISRRQLMRYIRDIRKAGINIDAKPGPRGGYTISHKCCPICKHSIEYEEISINYEEDKK